MMGALCECTGEMLSEPLPLVKGSRGFGACAECGGDRLPVMRVSISPADHVVGTCEGCRAQRRPRHALTKTLLVAGRRRLRERRKLCATCVRVELLSRDVRGALVLDYRDATTALSTAVAPTADVR